MKLKRFLSIAVSVCIALSVCAIARAFVPEQSASAIPANVKLYGYEYDIEYILRDFGLSKLGDNTEYAKGRTVTYQLIKDGSEDIAENTEGYSESKAITASSKIKFLRSDCAYKFTVTNDETSESEEFTVYTVDQADKGTEYTSSETLLSAYREAVKEYVADFKTTSTFKFSELEKNLSLSTVAYNPYFDILNSKVVVNYYLPGSTSVSTSSGNSISSLSFKTTKVGDYSFYLTFTDPLNNKDSIDDLEIGKGGFYADSNADGTIDDSVDELKIPVFTFTVTETAKPEVSVSVSEKAYLNLEYKFDSFAITATDYTTDYKLYFIPSTAANAYYDKDADEYEVSDIGDEKYIDAVLANSAVKDVTDIFDADSLKFTPTEKGYYYVLLNIYNAAGYSDRIMSYSIACLDEYKEVVPEKQFFKYNTTSIIFLSISALSFVGIIVVIFIKPKKEKDLETKAEKQE